MTFSVPQSVLPDLRKALAAESATIEAIVPGEKKAAAGAVTMIENTVDAGTGMVAVRATMQNADEFLWPGTLVTAQMTLREEEAGHCPLRRRPGQPVRQLRVCGQGRQGGGAARQGCAHAR